MRACDPPRAAVTKGIDYFWLGAEVSIGHLGYSLHARRPVRLASCLAADSDRPMMEATWSKSTANMSCNTNTSRLARPDLFEKYE